MRLLFLLWSVAAQTVDKVSLSESVYVPFGLPCTTPTVPS